MRIGYLRETPITVMKKNHVSHDTVPYFMERFRDAYTLQLQDFARNVLQERQPPVTIEDGLEALRTYRPLVDSPRTDHLVGELLCLGELVGGQPDRLVAQRRQPPAVLPQQPHHPQAYAGGLPSTANAIRALSAALRS